MSLKSTDHAITFFRDRVQKGRGATQNLEGRFEAWQREALDDGWLDSLVANEAADATLAHGMQGADTFSPETIASPTTVTEEIAKSIISQNDSPDIPFRYSVNPYRGCEHGCVYCFARPSHAYLGLSPGLDFETRLFAKINAPELLRDALSKPSYRPDVIAFGINTDAYQPIEKKYRLTRTLLEIMLEARQPVGLITKSSLIERDIDLLQEMVKHNLVSVTISITTLNHDISRYMEPRTTAPSRRMATVAALSEAGIPVGVNVAPVIPFLTDSELETILETAAARGATRAGYVLLRLPHELKPLFRDWLQQHFPLKAEHVMSRLNDMRGGKDNDPRFGTRMTGEGVFAKLLKERFNKAAARAGLNLEGRRSITTLDASHFRSPYLARQGALF
jgi:DNA repair photolyase